MTERISLVEAYDNRDVIAQLVRLRDDVDELLNILRDLDPNGDLTNVVTKTGDQTIDGVKTFIGKIVANCDIIQNGAAYETHAEQVYTTKDYIVLRDGALGGLPAGDFSGLRVNKYDSVNDGHLVMDRDGVARVGDVNDEQPLMTRDEVNDMTSGALVKWDGVNQKAIAPASNTGSDSKPIKLVNGEPVAVTNDLMTNILPNMTDNNILVVFGTNGPGGEYYSSFVGLRNADQKTITCTYLSAVGISVVDPNLVTIVKSATGYYLKCTDSSVAGRSCAAYITFS